MSRRRCPPLYRCLRGVTSQNAGKLLFFYERSGLLVPARSDAPERHLRRTAERLQGRYPALHSRNERHLNFSVIKWCDDFMLYNYSKQGRPHCCNFDPFFLH